MGYNQINRLLRVIEIQTIVLEYSKREITQKFVYKI